jgi:hypothetical protein
MKGADRRITELDLLEGQPVEAKHAAGFDLPNKGGGGDGWQLRHLTGHKVREREGHPRVGLMAILTIAINLQAYRYHCSFI